MSGPFKMKGYSYPGTSPLKQGFEGIDPSKDVVKVTKGGGFEKIGFSTTDFNKARVFSKSELKAISKIPKPKATSGINVKNLVKSGKRIIGKSLGFLGSKSLGIAGMMMATSSKADQPKKGKGKIEYPGGKMDFTK